MRLRAAVLILLCGAVLAGCVTGGSQLESTVYANNRLLRKIETDLGTQVSRLSDNAADLSQRLDQNDVELRTLRGAVEEVQVHVAKLQTSLNDMTRNVYRALNITLGSAGGTSAPGSDFVSVDRIRVGEAQLQEGSGQPATTGDAEAAVPTTVAGGAVTDYAAAQKSMMNQDYEAALKQFDEYLLSYAQSDYADDAQYWKADCYFRMGQYDKAIEQWEQLRSNYPDSSKVPLAIYNQAEARLRLGQIDEAKALFKAVVENYPIAPTSDRARMKLRELEGG
jgi:tol-pal system protein YbgF